MAAFVSTGLALVGAASENKARCTSSVVALVARRTTKPPSQDSHSSMAPGPTPKVRRTSAGMEIWPCAVIREWSSFIHINYPGNACGTSKTACQHDRITSFQISDQITKNANQRFFCGRFQPSRVSCFARATVSLPAGTSLVTVDPAPTVAPSPIDIGATNTELEPV